MKTAVALLLGTLLLGQLKGREQVKFVGETTR